MEKSDFYKDRILWKVKQHNLLGDKCCLFDDLPEPQRSDVLSSIHLDSEPVIIFWQASDQWTLVSTEQIYSMYNGSVQSYFLDNIAKKISVVKKHGTATEIKTENEFLSLGVDGMQIWAPKGKEIFALMNILMMFPLKSRHS